MEKRTENRKARKPASALFRGASVALTIALVTSNLAQATCLSKYENELTNYRKDRNSTYIPIGIAAGFLSAILFPVAIPLLAVGGALGYDYLHVDEYEDMIALLKDARNGQGPALSKLHAELKTGKDDGIFSQVSSWFSSWFSSEKKTETANTNFTMTEAELAARITQADASEKMCSNKMINRSELKQALLGGTWFGTPGDLSRDPRVADDRATKPTPVGPPMPLRPELQQPVPGTDAGPAGAAQEEPVPGNGEPR